MIWSNFLLLLGKPKIYALMLLSACSMTWSKIFIIAVQTENFSIFTKKSSVSCEFTAGYVSHGESSM